MINEGVLPFDEKINHPPIKAKQYAFAPDTMREATFNAMETAQARPDELVDLAHQADKAFFVLSGQTYFGNNEEKEKEKALAELEKIDTQLATIIQEQLTFIKQRVDYQDQSKFSAAGEANTLDLQRSINGLSDLYSSSELHNRLAEVVAAVVKLAANSPDSKELKSCYESLKQALQSLAQRFTAKQTKLFLLKRNIAANANGDERRTQDITLDGAGLSHSTGIDARRTPDSGVDHLPKGGPAKPALRASLNYILVSKLTTNPAKDTNV